MEITFEVSFSQPLHVSQKRIALFCHIWGDKEHLRYLLRRTRKDSPYVSCLTHIPSFSVLDTFYAGNTHFRALCNQIELASWNDEWDLCSDIETKPCFVPVECLKI